jgi:hypothetical protein
LSSEARGALLNQWSSFYFTEKIKFKIKNTRYFIQVRTDKTKKDKKSDKKFAKNKKKRYNKNVIKKY